MLGPAEVREAGRDTANRTPLDAAPVRLGSNALPGCYYPLGDGETAESRAALERLMRHMRGAPPA